MMWKLYLREFLKDFATFAREFAKDFAHLARVLVKDFGHSVARAALAVLTLPLLPFIAVYYMPWSVAEWDDGENRDWGRTPTWGEDRLFGSPESMIRRLVEADGTEAMAIDRTQTYFEFTKGCARLTLSFNAVTTFWWTIWTAILFAASRAAWELGAPTAVTVVLFCYYLACVNLAGKAMQHTVTWAWAMARGLRERELRAQDRTAP